MSKLTLRKDRKTGEPIRKIMASKRKALVDNYLVVKAYDNEKEVTQTGIDLGDK